MKVLVACEYSGIVRDAFTAKGHEATSCDLLPSETKGSHLQGDVLNYLGAEKWDLMIAHPPCTHLSVSGARWFPPHSYVGEQGFKPLYLRFEALGFVDRLMHADIPRICIENPVSVISSFIRKPDQSINPWEFGHPETKCTCLWLKGLPKLKPTENVYDEMMALPNCERQRILWLGSKKGHERSRFYLGFAEAMADQWGSGKLELQSTLSL